LAGWNAARDEDEGCIQLAERFCGRGSDAAGAGIAPGLAGTNIAGVEAQPLGGVIDAEITSNRPDCLGVYGIAREVSAIYKLPLKPGQSEARESSPRRLAAPFP
jgi:phenylalanyl-tRNA synthetase beta chain